MTIKRRVLLLDNSVATTGAYRSAVALAEAIHSHAETVFVLPPAPALHLEVASLGFGSHVLPMVEIGRTFRRLASYLPTLVVNGARLRRILSRERTDVLIANDYYNLLPAMMRLMGWRGRIITIVRLLPSGQQPLLNRIWIAAARFASSRVIAVSRAVASQLPSDLPTEVLYFPVGRGLESIPFLPSHAAQQDSKLTFLYLANYIHGKGQMHALGAFARVIEAFPSARLRFVGGDMGLAKNARYRNALIDEAGRLGLEGGVEFSGPAEDVVSEIQEADIILNFSESESFSHTCVEAGLLGRPVIATRCGGPEEIIDDGHTGLLVPVRDMDGMGRAMVELASNPERRHRMGLAAWHRTRECFNAAGFAATMSRLIAS